MFDIKTSESIFLPANEDNMQHVAPTNDTEMHYQVKDHLQSV